MQSANRGGMNTVGFRLLLAGACWLSWAGAQTAAAAPSHVRRLGTLTHPALIESSGVVASRRYSGVLWTHNDGGKNAALYAVNRQGESLGVWPVVKVDLRDWEDIALDEADRLYIGDIGNNEAKRDTLAIYRVAEPNPKVAVAPVAVQIGWRLRFPGKPFDCESLFTWKDYAYVVSKVFKDQKAEMFRFALTESNLNQTLELVTRLPIDSPVTGADLSADGRQLGLVAHAGAFVFHLTGDPASAGHVKPYHTKFKDQNIEACCFVADGLLATSENRGTFLFFAKPFLPLR